VPHQERGDRRADRIPLGGDLGEPALEEPDIGPEEGHRAGVVGPVELAERAEEPRRRRGVGAAAEPPDDPGPPGRLAELPGQVPDPAEPPVEERPRLLVPARPQRVADRLLDQVERGAVLGQAPARPPRQADELLADQVVPGSPARLVAETGEVVADRRVDRDRAPGVADDQVPSRERGQDPAEPVGVEEGQGAG